MSICQIRYEVGIARVILAYLGVWTVFGVIALAAALVPSVPGYVALIAPARARIACDSGPEARMRRPREEREAPGGDGPQRCLLRAEGCRPRICSPDTRRCKEVPRVSLRVSSDCLAPPTGPFLPEGSWPLVSRHRL
jgi:hypothetical protein